jgi:hypothetical protein
VVAHNAAGSEGHDWCDSAFVISSSLAANPAVPASEFALSAIAPNPTPRAARIEYALPRDAGVRLSIVDVQGREIACLVDGIRPAGRHQATWSGRSGGVSVPAGVYFVRFDTPGRQFVKRLVLTR